MADSSISDQEMARQIRYFSKHQRNAEVQNNDSGEINKIRLLLMHSAYFFQP